MKVIKIFHGAFISWTDSILTEDSLKELINAINTMVPYQKNILECMMGYDMKKDLENYDHLSSKFLKEHLCFKFCYDKIEK